MLFFIHKLFLGLAFKMSFFLSFENVCRIFWKIDIVIEKWGEILCDQICWFDILFAHIMLLHYSHLLRYICLFKIMYIEIYRFFYHCLICIYLKMQNGFKRMFFMREKKIWSKGKILRKILIFYENIGKLSKF